MLIWTGPEIWLSPPQLTSFVVAGVPFSGLHDSLRRNLKLHHSPLESDDERSSSACKTPNLLAELDFADHFAESFVPEDDFVGRVLRVATSTDEED